MIALRALSRTKLYWGLLLIFAVGALYSPVTSSGKNIFLSYGNLTDVLRQVSITGLVATGMTLVILVGGIDLSVGSVMAFSTVVCAMLLTKAGWTSAAIMGVPARIRLPGGKPRRFPWRAAQPAAKTNGAEPKPNGNGSKRNGTEPKIHEKETEKSQQPASV